MEQGYEIPERPKKVAYLVEKKYPAKKLIAVLQQAKEARENGQQVQVVRMNKNKKFQKEQLQKEGYEEFVEFLIEINQEERKTWQSPCRDFIEVTDVQK